MTTKARVGTRSGVPVVSLTNPRTAPVTQNCRMSYSQSLPSIPQCSAEFCWNSREISNFANVF